MMTIRRCSSQIGGTTYLPESVRPTRYVFMPTNQPFPVGLKPRVRFSVILRDCWSPPDICVTRTILYVLIAYSVFTETDEELVKSIMCVPIAPFPSSFPC